MLEATANVDYPSPGADGTPGTPSEQRFGIRRRANDMALLFLASANSDPERRSVVDICYGRTLRVGTLYSGADLIMKLLTAFVNQLSQLVRGLNFRIEHVFSADDCPVARKFMLKSTEGSMANVFGCVSTLSAAEAWCYRCGRYVPVRYCDLVVAGTVCGGFSALNNSRASNRNCLVTGDHLGGKTWQYLILFLRAHRPAFLVLENTREFLNENQMGESAIHTARSDLSCEGYGMIHFLMNAQEYGDAQHRVRMYLLAARGGFTDQQLARVAIIKQAT